MRSGANRLVPRPVDLLVRRVVAGDQPLVDRRIDTVQITGAHPAASRVVVEVGEEDRTAPRPPHLLPGLVGRARDVHAAVPVHIGAQIRGRRRLLLRCGRRRSGGGAQQGHGDHRGAPRHARPGCFGHDESPRDRRGAGTGGRPQAMLARRRAPYIVPAAEAATTSMDLPGGRALLPGWRPGRALATLTRAGRSGRPPVGSLMGKLSYTLLAALTAAALAVPATAATLPADVTASRCIAGGGVIVISAVGDVSQGYTKRCMGGVHDGQTVL
jgi:hypothetical protein